MEVNVYIKKGIFDHPLLGIIGEFTGIAKSLYEALADYDEPEIFNVIVEGHERQKASAPFVRAGGAGTTIREAMNRALGEFIERHCLLNYAETILDEVIFATYRELAAKGERVLSPDKMPLFSEKQYNIKFPFKKVTKDTLLGWVKGMSLLSGEFVYVPAQVIFMGYKRAQKEPLICPTTTSGTSAGVSYESATLGGIYEILERDAIMRTWYLRKSHPKLLFLHRYELQDILRRIVNKGFSYSLVLLPCQLAKVYVTLSCAVNNDDMFPKFVVGSAANLNPIESCYKSLLESAQGIPFVKMLLLVHHAEKINLGKITDFDLNVAFYGDPKNFKHVPFLLASETLISIDALTNNSCGNTEEDLSNVIKEIKEKSIETIVFDVTLPSLEHTGFRVVKVFCPELASLSIPSYPFLGNRALCNPQNIMPHPYP